MKLSTNVIVQALGTVGQALNLASGMVPPKYQFWIAGALGIVQSISGILAHFSNPDGTPSTTAYVK